MTLTNSMRTNRTSTRTLRAFSSAIFLLLGCMMLCAATAFAASLTGVVTDRTTGKPSAGDTIAVINTAQSMNELAKTTSDAQGRFHVNAPDGGQTLLHVTHRGAEYFKSVTPGASSVAIDVYDSAAKIDGISGEALVLSVETDASGKTLQADENFGVMNSSAPPRTEVGGNTFDFYLPKGAAIVQAQANSPGGMPTNPAVKTRDAASGHYAFTFPVRPGETRFQVIYSLPYNGKQAFSLKLSMPTGDVAVMLPKAMQFQGPSEFQAINLEANAQSYDAHQHAFAQPVEFSIGGTGQLPQTQEDAQGAAQGSAQGMGGQSGNGGQVAANGTRPGGGLGAPDDPNGTNDPWARYKWWILSLLGLALVVGAGVMLKAGAPSAVAGADSSLPSAEGFSPLTASAATGAAAVAAVAAAGPGVLLHALRDELFALETDRLAGKLSEAQYAEHKAAFDVVLRRALARSEAAPAASTE
jgi:5-hydroxyisourate hydrolase-like protein (transthyretin family)